MIPLAERPDVKVERHGEWVHKIGLTPLGKEQVANGYRFLKKHQSYVPTGVRLYDNTLFMRYYEEKPVEHEPLFQRRVIEFLLINQALGIEHTDLTRYSVIVHGSLPIVIDWDNAKFVWEDYPKKRPAPDYKYMLEGLSSYDSSRVFRRFLAIAPYVKGTVWDLGCNIGRTTALLRLLGSDVRGFDNNAFGEGLIDQADDIWSKYGCAFHELDLMDINIVQADQAVLFSTWSYLVRDYGWEKAVAWLENILSQVETFFFENQLHGDGPGPLELQSENDIVKLFKHLGASEIVPLTTIHLPDRNTYRTTWRISK